MQWCLKEIKRPKRKSKLRKNYNNIKILLTHHHNHQLNHYESIVQPATFFSGWLSSTCMSENSLEGLGFVHFVMLEISNTTRSFPSDKHREVGWIITRLCCRVWTIIFKKWKGKKKQSSQKLMLSSSDIQSTDRQGVVISTVFILVRKQLTLSPIYVFLDCYSICF